MASSKFREPVDEVFGKCCLVLSLAKATWHGEVGGRGLGSLGDFSVCVCVCVVALHPDYLSALSEWTCQLQQQYL